MSSGVLGVFFREKPDGADRRPSDGVIPCIVRSPASSPAASPSGSCSPSGSSCVGVAGGFAGKLTDVQDNEASSWLPASAESTKALDKLAPFQDQNDIPTVVVYEQPGGLTAGDLAGDASGQVAAAAADIGRRRRAR